MGAGWELADANDWRLISDRSEDYFVLSAREERTGVAEIFPSPAQALMMACVFS